MTIDSKRNDNASMLFHLTKDNIGMLNYVFNQKTSWDGLNALAKEQFTVFADTVTKLLVIDQADITENPKKDPPEWAEWRKEIFKHLKEKRSYKLTTGQRAGEAKMMSWLFKEGYTPEQIIKAFDTLLVEPFWQGKPLTIMSVAKQIGAMTHKKEGHQASLDKFATQKYGFVVQR